jgi:hypothetical protein
MEIKTPTGWKPSTTAHRSNPHTARGFQAWAPERLSTIHAGNVLSPVS